MWGRTFCPYPLSPCRLRTARVLHLLPSIARIPFLSSAFFPRESKGFGRDRNPCLFLLSPYSSPVPQKQGKEDQRKDLCLFCILRLEAPQLPIHVDKLCWRCFATSLLESWHQWSRGGKILLVVVCAFWVNRKCKWNSFRAAPSQNKVGKRISFWVTIVLTKNASKYLRNPKCGTSWYWEGCLARTCVSVKGAAGEKENPSL